MDARAAGRTAGGRAPLSRERVLRVAIALADRDGIGSLTMRRLAEELGVEAMSLYYYVANKDDILSGIVDLVLSEIGVPSGGRDWKGAIRKTATSFHAALLRHPWAATVINVPRKIGAARSIGVARPRYMDWVLRRLREAGFSPHLTHHAYHALDSHIMGTTLWQASFSPIKGDVADLGRAILRELPADAYPDFAKHVRQHITGSMRGERGTFEFGLDLILDGLERLRKTAARRSVSGRYQTGRARRRSVRRRGRRRTPLPEKAPPRGYRVGEGRFEDHAGTQRTLKKRRPSRRTLLRRTTSSKSSKARSTPG